MNDGEGSTSRFSETTIASSNQVYINPVTAARRTTKDDNNLSVSLLLNLSTIQNKLHQVQSLVSFFMISSNNNNQSLESTSSLAVTKVKSLAQEIITAASSVMVTCQQLQIVPESSSNLGAQERVHTRQNLDLHGTKTINPRYDNHSSKSRSENYEILELGVSDLLAKYTHHCQVCGKGFKRDANLRMHMRSHGDEYKTREALIGPTGQDKKVEYSLKRHYYYSCPQQGCRWNQEHEKFQPLKSAICAKNHYKRSHCPKMYMCRRCSAKQFSVLSDLKTHEKHCGDVKWVCSCGTRFSRKEKLMSHVSLFLGHSPAHGPPPQQPPMIHP